MENQRENGVGVVEEEKKKAVKTIKLLVVVCEIICLAPIATVCLLLLVVGSVGYFAEHDQAKGYAETTGQLYSVDCETNSEDEEWCEASYIYEVNDEEYRVSPARKSGQNGFKEEETVWYDPGNPGEAMIYAGWTSQIITGLIGVAAVSAIVIWSVKGKKARALWEKIETAGIKS